METRKLIMREEERIKVLIVWIKSRIISIGNSTDKDYATVRFYRYKVNFKRPIKNNPHGN